MSNQKQLDILKQGVDVWNKWREENDNEGKQINLSDADLKGADLSKANLTFVDLSRADLSDSNLYYAVLGIATLNNANLSRARLKGANFHDANLSEINFSDANLDFANFKEAYLRGANFSKSSLYRTNLDDAFLKDADFTEAEMGLTTISFTDFSDVKGLEFVRHKLGSLPGVSTLRLSKGKIPEAFLRGCGLSDWEIESAKLYDPNLTTQDMDEILYRVHDIRAHQPVQISPLFISYSHTDSTFVDRVEKSLDERGIRFWRDIHHSTAGPLEKQIDRAITRNPTVLVILSKNSIESDWVQHEVRKARELEKDIGRHVLCPIRLDDSFFSSSWPERIKEQVTEYNILNFSKWEDDKIFDEMFVRLIDGLNLYYKKDDDK